MTVYGGYDPATFQAWALNLFNTAFVSAGIARGFNVTQTATPGMAVLVNLDSTWNDGVIYLSNGTWMRIDAATTLAIGSNTSGITRTDALIATVDPTNNANLSLAIQANWANGFTGGTNQFVVALISVANNATQILNASISMNSATAKITTGAGGANSLQASDGVGLTVQDNSATSTLTLVMTGLTTGVGRNLALQTTDASSIGHTFTFGTQGTIGGVHGAQLSIGTASYGDILLQPANGNWVYMYATDGSGSYTQVRSDGWLYRQNGTDVHNYGLMTSAGGGASGKNVWSGTTDPAAYASEGDIWVAQ